MSRRLIGVAGLIAQVVFVLSWLAAAWQGSRYSTVRHTNQRHTAQLDVQASRDNPALGVVVVWVKHHLVGTNTISSHVVDQIEPLMSDLESGANIAQTPGPPDRAAGSSRRCMP